MTILISVVVPVYSGEAYLELLVQKIEAIRNDWISRSAVMSLAELVLVEDGAIDGSSSLIDDLAKVRPWVNAVHLSRNFGQHAATIAGIMHTSGDWVVTMDEDLQHLPIEIENLLREAATNSSDIVYAQPSEGVHASFARDASSRFYKLAMSKLSGNENIRLFNSFRLIRGSISRAAASVCGYETYYDVALSWFTKRVSSVPMPLRDERYAKSGKSGYKFSKLLSHARRMAMSSQVKIMRTAALLGGIVVIFSFICALALIVLKLETSQSIPIGWTTLAVSILFFGGLTTFLLGIVIEYISSLNVGAHGRPVFFVIDRKLDFSLKAYFEGLSK